MNERIKVLLICPTVACYIGGTETVVAQLSQRLKSQVQLTVLSGESGHRKADLIDTEGFQLLTVPFLGRDTRLNGFISKLLMCSPFKVESYSFFRSLTKSGMDISGYDCIATFYEADAVLLSKWYPHLRERAKHFLPGVSTRRFFRNVAAENVFFLGYRAASRAKKKWGVIIPSLPLGVDEEFFPQTLPAYPASRKLVYVGRLDKSKHVDWLMNFFAESELNKNGYQLEIVGDGPLFEPLKARFNGAKGIVFHGKKRQEDVVGILQQAHLLLHPTDHESFGLTILEAMAAGIPVITHDLTSIRAWASDHPRYATFLNQLSWIDEIAKFEVPAYWEAVSAASRSHAESFTWHVLSTKMLHLMQNNTLMPEEKVILPQNEGV